MLRKLPSFPFRAGVIGIIFALVVIALYTLYAALPYLLGPSLSIDAVNADGMTTISGKTERVSFLSIDGAVVPLSEDGTFFARRAYPVGYTETQVSVKDRFGRTLTKTLTFVNK
ncbi:hypothetical protein HY090_00440 [Candidatus Kaiserbacteria bacterium]|nr:hypothetical protein [Candidatus Kaiserbacteria bacterium]